MRRPTYVVFDTNVWVALFRRTLHRAMVNRIAGKRSVMVPPIVMAELASLVERGNLSVRARRFVESAATVVTLDGDEAWAAGRRYGRWGPRSGGGIADALILEAASALGGILITFDEDFEGERNVHVLPAERS